MAIGLCGAHNTGKTTLAREYAAKHGLEFVETSVSAIFRELGLDASNPPRDFHERLLAQTAVLQRLDAMYERRAGQQVVYDRTPIDTLAYMVAEALGSVVDEKSQEAFAKYVDKCFDVLNRHFSLVVLVQPGIALEAREGRGALNQAYIEHLNALMLGYSCDERNKVPRYYIPRYRLSIEDRLVCLHNAVQKTVDKAVSDKQEALLH